MTSTVVYTVIGFWQYDGADTPKLITLDYAEAFNCYNAMIQKAKEKISETISFADRYDFVYIYQYTLGKQDRITILEWSKSKEAYEKWQKEHPGETPEVQFVRTTVSPMKENN